MKAVNLHDSFCNLKQVYRNTESFMITTVSSAAIGFVKFYFINYELTAGNMGKLHANLEVASQLILALLFGINITLLLHKLKFAHSVNAID